MLQFATGGAQKEIKLMPTCLKIFQKVKRQHVENWNSNVIQHIQTDLSWPWPERNVEHLQRFCLQWYKKCWKNWDICLIKNNILNGCVCVCTSNKSICFRSLDRFLTVDDSASRYFHIWSLLYLVWTKGKKIIC